MKNEFRKLKPGRPKKMVWTESELTSRIHTVISRKHRAMVPEDVSWRELFEWAIEVRYGDPVKRQYRELKEKEARTEVELYKLKAAVADFEEKQRVEEEIRKTLRIEERYPATAFRHLLKVLRTNNRKITEIHMKEEVIIERWGIEFDRERLNKDFHEFLVEYDEGLISDEELVKQYSIRKTRAHSFWEKEINETIEKEVGLR